MVSRSYLPHLRNLLDLERKADIQEHLTPSSGQQTVIKTLTTPAKALMDTSKLSETILKGVDSFMEAVPPIMKALDEVAKIHPFINGAISLFWHHYHADGLCPV